MEWACEKTVWSHTFVYVYVWVCANAPTSRHRAGVAEYVRTVHRRAAGHFIIRVGRGRGLCGEVGKEGGVGEVGKEGGVRGGGEGGRGRGRWGRREG